MNYSLPLLLVGSLFLAWCGATPPSEIIQDSSLSGMLDEVVLTGSESLSGEVVWQDNSQSMTGELAEYTLEDVASHTDKDSGCWTAINGKVYDVTELVTLHYGWAEAIVKLCGVDGSVSFEKWHAGEQKAAETLAKYQIGILVQ